MRIIFLDIDGVLNYEEFYVTRDINDFPSYPLSEICLVALERLSKLCEDTGAKVVISSSWRHNRTLVTMQQIFSQLGFRGEIIDYTPDLGHADYILRGNEILAWIMKNHEMVGFYQYYKNYVIIDDDEDFLLDQKDHFFQTSPIHGLTDELCEQIKLYYDNVSKKSMEQTYEQANN